MSARRLHLPDELVDRLERRFGFLPCTCPNCDVESAIAYDPRAGDYLVSCNCTTESIDAALRSSKKPEEVSPSPRCKPPRSSFLVPCPTEPDEPEVEQLLRLHAEGKIEPVEVLLPDLPPDAGPAVEKVAELYRLVRGVRLWAGDDRPVPFAVRWVEAKLGLPRETVNRSLGLLADYGVLVPAGTLPARKGRRGTNLWSPGVVAQAEIVPFRPRVAAAGGGS